MPIRIVVLARFVFPHLPPWMLGGRLRDMPLMGSRRSPFEPPGQGGRREGEGGDQKEGNKGFDHWGSPCVVPLLLHNTKGRRAEATATLSRCRASEVFCSRGDTTLPCLRCLVLKPDGLRGIAIDCARRIH